MCFPPYFYNMRRKRFLLILFLVFTGINILVFIFRDHFQYRPISSYRELYQTCDRECAGKWSRFIDDYPREEFAEAKQIMDSVLKDSLSGFDKVLLTGSFLYEKFHRQLGVPSSELPPLSPLQQFKLLSADTSQKLWCGQFAAMYAYFSWTQDIACRYIEMMKAGDRHVLNEVYIPEIGRWVMLDLTHNIMATRNGNGTFLDLLAVRDSATKNAQLTVYRNDKGGWEKSPVNARELPAYYQHQLPLYYHYRINNEAVYGIREKINRYFFPDSWYEIYSIEGGNNQLFQVKRILFALWLLSFFVFLISLAKFKI